MGERILVTGGAGFIGSHVVDAYLAAGHEVAIVDNLSTGRRENLNPDAAFYEVDIRDAEGLAEVFDQVRPQVVNHHAAHIDVRVSVTHPHFDAETNVLGSINLLEAARAAGTVRKLIYISSGGAAYGEPEYLPCDEKHPVHPLAPYGASKYTVEVYLDVYRQTHGLTSTILRYANVYGPRQDPLGEAGVVAIFTGRMLEGKPPTVYGSGEQARDFVYVKDCARANLLALDRGDNDVFNIGTGERTTVNHIAELLQAHTGYEGEIVHGPEQPGEVFEIYLDCTRAREHLGWTPTVDLDEGLALTVAQTVSS
ncbi:MAG: NAD-dependent epimerase/dehydratase family protein [Anaerolineae bacterium]